MADDSDDHKDKPARNGVDDAGGEEDKVAEAYESISKKLENLRNPKDDPDDDLPEDATTLQTRDEKPQKKEHNEEDQSKEEEHEDEDLEKEDQEKPLDPLPGTDDDNKPDEPKPTFKPEKDDPLDNEDVEDEQNQPDKDETEDYHDEAAKKEIPEENLDDLAEDRHIPQLKPNHQESVFPQNEGYNSDISFSKPSFTEPNPNNYFNRHTTDRPPRRGNIWHLLILILIGLAVIGGTVYLLKYQFGSSTVTPTPSPSPTTQEPTPSPTPTFDRSKFKIRVLNGTTTSGLAKTVSDKLKGLGYQIDKTGNAPKQDVKQTQVSVKSSAAALADQLTKDLASDYQASAGANLKDSDTADGEVTLGQK